MGRVGALYVGTVIRRRFGGLGAVVMVPPASITIPYLAWIPVGMLDLTETVVRTRYVVISHDAIAMQTG